jgi:hypothetical protein
VAAGVGVGFTWGVVARVWMRLISEDPEFSWSGTIYIVAVPTLIGLFMGVAYHARRAPWRSWARRAAAIAAGVVVLPLGLGAGILTLPTIVLGGVVIRGIPESRSWRLVAVLLPVAASPAVRGFEGFGLLGIAILMVVLAVAAAAIVSRRFAGILVASFAVLPVVAVVATVVDADIALWRKGLGSLVYLPLVAIGAVAFGSIVLAKDRTGSMLVGARPLTPEVVTPGRRT